MKVTVTEKPVPAFLPYTVAITVESKLQHDTLIHLLSCGQLVSQNYALKDSVIALAAQINASLPTRW